MVGAVIVVYNPNVDLLCKVYDSIVDFIDHVVVVVNGDENHCESEYFKNVIYLNGNLGIGKASNVGANYLFKNFNLNYVVFCDQDTVFSYSYFNQLRELIHLNPNFIYAPKYLNENIGKVENRMVVRKSNRVFTSIVESEDVYQVIASGMAVPKECFTLLQGFREDLFIDWVDLEFCWRCYKNGFKIKMLNTQINHYLGDSSFKIGNFEVPLRSGIRYYYLIRNGYYLALNFNHGSKRINLWFLVKVSKEFFGYTVLSIFKFKDLKLIMKGLIHGLTGRLNAL
jgi:rhamnosyltransferase